MVNNFLLPRPTKLVRPSPEEPLLAKVFNNPIPKWLWVLIISQGFFGRKNRFQGKTPPLGRFG